MATTVAPGNSAFAGGGLFPAGVPTSGPTGSIAGANVGGSLIAGVAGSAPLMARPSRGSNISIPYARVVMHPAGRTALPTVGEKEQTQLYLGKPTPAIISETDRLYTGRIAFVLGRRGTGFDFANRDNVIEQILGDEYLQSSNTTVNARMQSRLQNFSGGVDLNSMSRLCSFEYVELYFHHVLRKKTIDLGGNLNLLPGGNGLPPKFPTLDPKPTLNDVNGKFLLTRLMTSTGSAPSPEVTALLAKVEKSGVFAADDGPFLRGKALDTKLVDGVYRGGGKAPLNLGDTLAFQALELKLKELGALDWAPDGIVLSKLTSGQPGADGLVDDEIDSRDGQLFNVTVSGPAITSNYCNDSMLEVMPLDKVFVVIVGDVWRDMDDAQIATVWTNDARDSKDGDYKKYDDAFKTYIGADDRDVNAPFGNNDRGKLLGEPAAKEVITNLQIMRMTSSQMINYSSYKKGDKKSRCGLPIGNKGGRYVIGGWCLGTVLDSSAARATHDGVSLVGAVKRARTSHACNVIVSIEWWEADRMFRQFMNRGSLGSDENAAVGVLRSRYEPKRRPVDPLNSAASGRPSAQQIAPP